MQILRAWKYRLYPTKEQEKLLNSQLYNSKNLWNFLLQKVVLELPWGTGDVMLWERIAIASSKNKEAHDFSRGSSHKLYLSGLGS